MAGNHLAHLGLERSRSQEWPYAGWSKYALQVNGAVIIRDLAQ